MKSSIFKTLPIFAFAMTACEVQMTDNSELQSVLKNQTEFLENHAEANLGVFDLGNFSEPSDLNFRNIAWAESTSVQPCAGAVCLEHQTGFWFANNAAPRSRCAGTRSNGTLSFDNGVEAIADFPGIAHKDKVLMEAIIDVSDQVKKAQSLSVAFTSREGQQAMLTLHLDYLNGVAQWLNPWDLYYSQPGVLATGNRLHVLLTYEHSANEVLAVVNGNVLRNRMGAPLRPYVAGERPLLFARTSSPGRIAFSLKRRPEPDAFQSKQACEERVSMRLSSVKFSSDLQTELFQGLEDIK